MATEVIKGRACIKLDSSNQALILSQDQLIKDLKIQIHNQDDKIGILNTLNGSLNAHINLDRSIGAMEKAGLKRKIKQLRTWLIGAVGLDVVIVAVVLLI